MPTPAVIPMYLGRAPLSAMTNHLYNVSSLHLMSVYYLQNKLKAPYFNRQMIMHIYLHNCIKCSSPLGDILDTPTIIRVSHFFYIYNVIICISVPSALV